MGILRVLGRGGLGCIMAALIFDGPRAGSG